MLIRGITCEKYVTFWTSEVHVVPSRHKENTFLPLLASRNEANLFGKLLLKEMSFNSSVEFENLAQVTYKLCDLSSNYSRQ